jgi:hypothetical protein
LATLIAFGAGPANAQQREAVLHRINVPDTDYYLVVATAKSGAPLADFRGTPDPSLMYLAGGELVHAYDNEMQDTFSTLASMLKPVFTLHVKSTGGEPSIPVAVYLVPRANRLGSPTQ